MNIRSLSFIFLLIFGFLSLSSEVTEKIRNIFVSIATATTHVNVRSKYQETRVSEDGELKQLQIENSTLKEQLEQLQDYLLCDEKLERHKKYIEELHEKNISADASYILRREQELLKKMQAELRSIHAKVIFREPVTWNNYFWINVGQKDNLDKNSPVIAMNSPVVNGDMIVGVIDYVGGSQSRVRLITDQAVCVSARVIRGSSQNKLLLDPLIFLIDHLRYRGDIFFSIEELEKTLRILSTLEDNIKTSMSDRYLAKGEIQGTSMPLWRSRSLLLKGSGFNYDFDDEEGLSKDLRTGKLFKGDATHAEALIQTGDLLVTTGYDKIFPAGFKIGYVTEVDPLEEGAIFYEIKAKAAVYNLYELAFVQVLPPTKEEEDF